MMVESEAKELSEEEMLGAVMFAHKSRAAGLEAIIKLAEQAAKEPWELAPATDKTAIKAKLKDLIGKDIEAAYKLTNKSERSTALAAARLKAAEAFAEADPQEQLVAAKLVKSLEADIVRGAILKDGRRIDGRDTKTVRPIESDRRLPAAHSRVGFVHPRRDAGDLHDHAWHQGIRADDRRAGGPLLPALHAAL